MHANKPPFRVATTVLYIIYDSSFTKYKLLSGGLMRVYLCYQVYQTVFWWTIIRAYSKFSFQLTTAEGGNNSFFF